MDWLTQHLVQEWRMIKQAPLTFCISVLAAGLLIFTLLNFYYQQQQQTVQLLQAQMQQLQQQIAAQQEQEQIKPTKPRYLWTMENAWLKRTALAFADKLEELAGQYRLAQQMSFAAGKPKEDTDRELAELDKEIDITFREQHALNYVNLLDELKRRTPSSQLSFDDLSQGIIGGERVLGMARQIKEAVKLIP